MRGAAVRSRRGGWAAVCVAMAVLVPTALAGSGARVPAAALGFALGLGAEATDNAHVALRWQRAPGARSYVVYRQSALVARTSRSAFTDTLLWPGTRYRYTVAALGPAGTVLTSASATARTAPLPPAGFGRPFAAD